MLSCYSLPSPDTFPFILSSTGKRLAFTLDTRSDLTKHKCLFTAVLPNNYMRDFLEANFVTKHNEHSKSDLSTLRVLSTAVGVFLKV